jgi:RNA polymerase sigma-70 factor (ECF subfamily)
MVAEPFQFASMYQWMARSILGEGVLRPFSLQQEDKTAVVYTADLEDIRKSRNGDSDAYRRLIERYQHTIAKLLWRFTRDRNEHEELVQQVFVEAYISLASYGAKAPFAHWLARIATRVGYRYWSQISRHKTVSLQDEEWDYLSGPDDNTPRHHQAAEVVHRLLAQLPPRDRLVLTMRYLEQCDVAQTAYRIGWTQARVRVQTHRAIQKLKSLMAENQIELEL